MLLISQSKTINISIINNDDKSIATNLHGTMYILIMYFFSFADD